LFSFETIRSQQGATASAAITDVIIPASLSYRTKELSSWGRKRKKNAKVLKKLKGIYIDGESYEKEEKRNLQNTYTQKSEYISALPCDLTYG
jgi:hypothetical protein